MFEKFKAARGEYPHRDMEPTPDHLSAVSQLIESGAPPYVDFSLFGPHGRRLLKKLMFAAFTCLQRQELPGP
eukprot:4698026-Alexandrium_andersonii.AAC.1